MLISTAYLSADETLPPPYNELKTILPFNGHGWYINGPFLERLLLDENAKVVIELGSWLGKSIIAIANILPEDGIVYSVDHWYTPPYNKNIPYYYNLPEFDVPNLYNQFLSNIIHAGLTHKVIPVKMSSSEAAKVLVAKGIRPDIVYVDASHEEQDVYDDLTNYFPFIKGHGKICGDDWFCIPVQTAIKRYAEENNLVIECASNSAFWVLHEMPSVEP